MRMATRITFTLACRSVLAGFSRLPAVSGRPLPPVFRRGDLGLLPIVKARFSVTFVTALALFVLGAILAGCTPSLHDTVARHDVEAARAMIAGNPQLVMARNKLGKTPLHYAVTYGAPEMIDLLLENGADINAKDNTGLTPLHVAAMLGRTNEAQALIAHGADINARDSFGDTPLHTAALFGQARMVELLVNAGADLAALNNNQLTPLDCARQQRKSQVVDLIITLAN